MLNHKFFLISIFIPLIFIFIFTFLYPHPIFIFGKSKSSNKLPSELEDVSVKDPLGKNIDLSLPFTDEKGKQVTLKKYFNSHQPVLFSIVYYECPHLCTYHIKALLGGVKSLKWAVGKDFKILFLSMNHNEKPALALGKKKSILKDYARLSGAKGWTLLTGDEKNIRKLAESLNFKFKWIEEDAMFSHPSLTYVMTPEGQVSQVLSGLDSSSKNIKLALLEASKGRIGTFLDQIILFCYRFDPKNNRYTLYAYNIMRLAGLVTVLSLMSFFIVSFVQNKKRRKTLKIKENQKLL